MMDPDTDEPILSNVMNNFMDCSIMMFGSIGKYAITYKSGTSSFDIYRSKYIHDFKVLVSYEDFGGSKVINLENGNALLIY